MPWSWCAPQCPAPSTSCCTTASSCTATAAPSRGRRTGRRSSSAAATRSARASTCCSGRCPQLGADVRLWVAGSGPDSERLRTTLRRRRRASSGSGRCPTTRSSAACRGADVFCAPSLRGESFGVVLIEAMAAGTTVVASALDGYRNVATDDVDALLVEPGDVDALAEALRPGARRSATRGTAARRRRAAAPRTSRWTAGGALRRDLRGPGGPRPSQRSRLACCRASLLTAPTRAVRLTR